MQDAGISLGDILERVIEEQQTQRFAWAFKEACEERRDVTLVGFNGSKFYGAGSITFPEPIPRSIEKFRNVPLSVRTNIKLLYSRRGKVAVVSLIKALNRDCTLREAVDFADYCIDEQGN